MEHLAKIDVPLYKRNKRSGKLFKRQQRNLKASARALQSKAAVNKQFGESSKILSLLASGPILKPSNAKGKVRFVAPSVFSLMENSAGVLSSIQGFVQSLRSHARVRDVHIDLSKVTHYDLGANGLIDVIVEEIMHKAKITSRKIHWSGKYPSDPALRRFIKSMGVIKKIKLSKEYPEADEAARLSTYDDRCKNYVRAVRASEVDKKNRVTAKFADHIDSCLKHIGRTLTHTAKSKLCKYVAEILDNAEEHAGMLDWTIQGYLDTHNAEWSVEIVIFNFGKSIAHTLSSLPDGSYTRDKIKPYINAHQRHGYFGVGQWREEDLLTLIALQQGISSKNSTDADTRGIGTVELISFFQTMCTQLQAEGGVLGKMTLISGNTQIIFDHKYKMARNPRGANVIAFNATNDLHQRPDPSYVKGLGAVNFPGTLLAIKFPLPNQSTAAVPGAQS